MKLIYSIIVFKLLSLLLYVPHANGAVPEFKSADSITIQGSLNATRLSKYPDFKGEVHVYYSKYAGTLTDLLMLKDHGLVVVPCQLKEKFKIKIPCQDEYVFLHIAYTYPTQLTSETPFFSRDNIYVVKRGDSLNINIKDNYIDFIGKGSDKYICQSMIASNYENLDSSFKFFNEKNYSKYISQLNEALNVSLKNRINVLNDFKKSISKDYYEILMANSYAIKYFRLYGSFYMLCTGDLDFFKYARNEHIEYLIPKNILLLNEKILDKSPIYASSILLKKKVEIYLKGQDSIPKKPKYYDLLSALLKMPKGLVKDKLITYSFLQLTDNTAKPAIDYIDYAIGIVNDSRYKSVLLDIKKYKIQGTDLSEYSFTNQEGKLVKLNDFNDKILILDFWYTGCENCIILKEKMEPVIEVYKNNPKVKFISISIDNNIEKWKESIKGGKYTSLESINLYTGGSGAAHPFIKNFNIAGYPTVYVVKNGKLVSSSPPLPYRNEGATQFTKLIESLSL